MRAVTKTAISILCLVGSGLAIYNVESDNSAVVEMAEEEVCSGSCVRTLQVERGPLSQSFVFQTSIQPPKQARAKCTRQFFLFGEYSCQALR